MEIEADRLEAQRMLVLSNVISASVGAAWSESGGRALKQVQKALRAGSERL